MWKTGQPNARGVVAEVQPCGWFGRKGKLAIALKDVDLVTRERVLLRSYQSGGKPTLLITVLDRINPLGSILKGSNAKYPTGTEVNAFVYSNFVLDPAKFGVSVPPRDRLSP